MRMSTPQSSEAILLVRCPDQPGIVARVANCLHDAGANILDAAQHTEFATGTFLQRLHVSWPESVTDTECVDAALNPLRIPLDLTWSVSWGHVPRNVAIFVSKEDHCLHDLLLLQQRGELHCHVGMIVSNHPDLEDVAHRFDVPFFHTPMGQSGDPGGEAAQRALLQSHDIDLVVLARYMRILSAEFIAERKSRIINIHHSFLPAFAGARPYHQAHEKGVKLIGATAHFATAQLDEGPIIEQGVVRVSHRDSIQDMIRKGRDIERTVLARAVAWFLEDRIIVHDGRAIVFA